MMKVRDLLVQLNLKLFSDEQSLEREVCGAYVSDLLSDVVGFVKKNQVWITLHTHKNVIAIASLKEVAAVVLVKGYEPDSSFIDLANKEGIPILGTCKETFEISGELYALIKNSK